MQFVYREYNCWQDIGFGLEKSKREQGDRLGSCRCSNSPGKKYRMKAMPEHVEKREQIEKLFQRKTSQCLVSY